MRTNRSEQTEKRRELAEHNQHTSIVTLVKKHCGGASNAGVRTGKSVAIDSQFLPPDLNSSSVERTDEEVQQSTKESDAIKRQ